MASSQKLFKEPPTKSELEKAPFATSLFNTNKTTLLKSLLTHIVNGAPDEAKAILDKHPELVYEKLQEKDFVTSLSGHKFNLYPLQAALSVMDTEMATLILSYFKNTAEAQSQFNDQCPKGWETAELKNEKWLNIITQVNTKLLPAICHNKKHIISSEVNRSDDADCIMTLENNSPIEKELFEFRKLLRQALDEVVTAGKWAFFPALFLTILKIHNENFHKWSDPRSMLFVREVLGNKGIQSLLPVNFVQGCQDGLINTANKLEEKIPQGRSTSLFMKRNNQYITVDPYSSVRFSPDFSFMIHYKELSQYILWGDEVKKEFARLISVKYSKLTGLFPDNEATRTLSLNRNN